jgi:hypothetical protein
MEMAFNRWRWLRTGYETPEYGLHWVRLRQTTVTGRAEPDSAFVPSHMPWKTRIHPFDDPTLPSLCLCLSADVALAGIRRRFESWSDTTDYLIDTTDQDAKLGRLQRYKTAFRGQLAAIM